MNQGTVTSQRQTTSATLQQILVASMVEVTSADLEKMIVEETENNLALELEDPDVNTVSADNDNPDYDNADDGESVSDGDNSLDEATYRKESGDVDYFDYDDNSPSDNLGGSDGGSDTPWLPLVASDVTSVEELHQQVDELELEEEDAFVAHYIVDSLDDNGYLTRSTRELCDDISINLNRDIPEATFDRVLVDVVQSLEPTGIGARNLRECILLQLQEMKGKNSILAYNIVERCFDDLMKKSYDHILSSMQITDRQLADAMKIIVRINPKPGGIVAGTDVLANRTTHITPEFSIHEMDGDLEVQLLDGQLPVVRISDEYKSMSDAWQKEKKLNQKEKEGANFLKEKISSASLFIDALKQRHVTLSKVIQTIAVLQREYFLSGGNPDLLRPMVMQDVADITGYDISTISRVCKSKYIDTDFGIICMHDLFTNAYVTDDGVVSNETIKSILKEMIDEEDKSNPLSDEKLSQMFTEKGYTVARRTVAKYRELIGFPTARMRKEI